MLNRPLLLFIALALVASSVPMVGAQSNGDGGSDDVTFYGHVFGHTLDAPMPANTEAPVGEDNYGLGSFHWCTEQIEAEGAPPTAISQDGCQGATGNTLALFSSAGFVDVSSRSDFQQTGDYTRLHNERGQTKDIKLDPSGNLQASIFMSVDFHSWAVGSAETNCMHEHPEDVPCLYPYWGWDPGMQQDYVVQATMYKANLGDHGANASDAPPVAQAIAEGADVVAQGQWGPGQVITGLPGSENVLEFTIDMGPPQVDTIPRDEDFFVVYRFLAETGGQEWGVHSWRIWAGEFFPPSFNMPVENAFDVERVIPNFAHGKMAILGVMNTPWGSYDIDPDSVELEIEGPDGAVTPEHISQFGSFSVAHGGHYKPINMTWIWDYQQEGLSPGDYTVTVSATNFQGSAAGTCTATFILEQGEQGLLAPGQAEQGLCGQQSASEDFVEEITEGASEQGGN